MIKIIREVNKEELIDFLYDINIEDEKLYTELNDHNSIGIFQLKGKTASKLCEEVQPDNFEDANAVNALARPGPIEAAAPYFVKRKNGEASPYPEKVNEILSTTYGTMVYQEQIMSIFNKVGGFTLEGANHVRGLMKKLGKADKKESDLKEWDKTVKKFIRNAQKEGITEVEAKRVADDLIAFSGYSFNKSHSSSYTYIAIMTLYLSVYFRKYFYSSILDYEVDRNKYLIEVVNSIKAHGFEILPPNINKSEANIIPGEDNQILFGLINIKSVGEKSIEVILANKPYKSFIDFILKTRCRAVTSAVIIALISVGAFDEMYSNRKKLILMFVRFWKEKKSVKVKEKLEFLWEKINQETDRIPSLTTTITDLRNYEKDYFGMCIFTTLFTKIKIEAFNKMKRQNLIRLNFQEVDEYSFKVPVCINSVRAFNDKNQNEMAFVDIEDITGENISIPVFASYWKFIKEYFIPNNIYLMNIHRDDKGSILFGQKSWTTSEFRVLRMIKKI